jgi:hypothetical protein
MRYELSDHEWTAIKPMLPRFPSLRANGSAPTGRANARPMTGSAPPDDRLREAIQDTAEEGRMDCFVAVAPRNDGPEHDDFARRANHFVSLFRSCLAPLKKYFGFSEPKSVLQLAPSRPARGALRGRAARAEQRTLSGPGRMLV